jgi:TonB family protein
MTQAWKQYEGQIADGKFPLRQYLGGSGGSAVFLTEIAGPHPEKAAIKIVVADPRNADLQLARWRLAAKLSHPNLLKIFEVGRCRLGDVECLYVVMELAEEDVSQILPHRALTVEETRDMLGPVLEALTFLHGKGYVHGRVKPANIAAVDDRIKLSIDGVRRAGETGGGNYSASTYDAPEAASEKASPAADVWSLGMTLVEVLTQHLPPWERMGQKDPQVRDSMHAPLLDIARNCLRRDPRSRLTAQGIATRLQAGTPVLATPRAISVPRMHTETAAAQTQKASSTPKFAAAAIVIVVAATLIYFVARSFRQSANPQNTPSIVDEPATTTTPKPERAPEAAETKRPEAKENEKKAVAAELPAPAPTPLPAAIAEPPVKPASELVPGQVLHQVVPNVPQIASDTISGTVKVSVRIAVDAAGNVADASLNSPGPSKYFANLALKAARQWTFSPAKADGQGAPSEWVIRFEFTRDGAKAFPARSTSK